MQTKAWAVEQLRERSGQSMSLVHPWLDFTLSYNYGTAFSFIRDLGTARFLFGILALLTVVLLFVMSIRSDQRSSQAAAFGLVAGGAIGNGLQRLTSEGVVDFIKVNYPWGGSWPTFNVADILVVVGVALLLIDEYRHRKDPAPPG